MVISGCSAGGLATFLHTDQAQPRPLSPPPIAAPPYPLLARPPALPHLFPRPTAQWCDALASDAPALSKCVGMPDSGFFLDYQSSAVPATVEEEEPWEERGLSRRLNTLPGNYHAGLKWCFEAFNATAGVNQDYIAAKGTRRCVEAPSALCLVAPRALTDPGGEDF